MGNGMDNGQASDHTVSNELMTSEQRKKEIREAIAAGEEACAALKDAYDQLSGAGGWGLFDMLGGGLISSMMKHSKIDRAQEEMERAKQKLRIFREELRDVSIMPEFSIDAGGFLKFADLFLDNIFVDWMVQDKISNAKQQVSDAMDQVRSILNRLYGMMCGE